MAEQADQQRAQEPENTERLLALGRMVDHALDAGELWRMWFELLWISVQAGSGGLKFEVRGPSEEQAREWANERVLRRLVRAAVLAAWSFTLRHSVIDPPTPDEENEEEDDLDWTEELATMVTDSLTLSDPVERLKVFIALGVLPSEQIRDFELAVAAGEADEDEGMTIEAPDVPDDHDKRLSRAAVAALDAYYEPVMVREE
jgi:hypothetical protein